MATIETRKRGNGTTAYRLKWRYAGKRDGAPQSITYNHQGDAKAMKGAVEALRHLVYADDPRVQTFELVTGQREVTYTGPTFGHVVEAYVSTRTRAHVDTKELYRKTLTCQAHGLLSRPVESITDDDIRRLLAEITDAGKSVRMLYDLLGSVFKYATHKQWITVNPMRDVEAPKRRVRTTNFLDTSDAGVGCVSATPCGVSVPGRGCWWRRCWHRVAHLGSVGPDRGGRARGRPRQRVVGRGVAVGALLAPVLGAHADPAQDPSIGAAGGAGPRHGRSVGRVDRGPVEDGPVVRQPDYRRVVDPPAGEQGVCAGP